ncbi:hypothetical protein Acr_07g0015570 [Actinidia rufa]|uniref:Uncharacterized protein n=1 Tax=Actinidia rufa TaxID=165716 RepID=A0A7J0EY39_9ERIC|nr:hypothetical protein Acr_07g0015570 [Actinidia rufa]
MKKKLKEQFLYFDYMQTSYNNLLDLKQGRKSVSKSVQQYQINSKFGQAFQSYSNTGSSPSVGKSGNFGAKDPFPNGGFKGLKCGKVGHKLEDCDKASKDTSEALFAEEEMDGIEEDEAVTLMMLDTFQEVNHTLGLCPNVQKVVCEVTLGLWPKVQEEVCEAPPTIEDLIVSKVEECFQDLPSKMPFMQYTQVCDALVPETALVFKSAHQVSPKVGKDFVGQLEDPLGMVFTRASFGYDL